MPGNKSAMPGGKSAAICLLLSGRNPNMKIKKARRSEPLFFKHGDNIIPISFQY